MGLGELFFQDIASLYLGALFLLFCLVGVISAPPYIACRILVPWPEIQPKPPALGERSLNTIGLPLKSQEPCSDLRPH